MSNMTKSEVPQQYELPLPEPDIDELQQREEPLVSVPVKVTEPLQTHELPCRHAAAFTQVLTDTTYVKILAGPDLKRKRVWINCDADIFVSFTGNSGSGARLHGAASIQGVLETSYIGSIWIAGVTGTINVGVMVEYWAD